MLTYIIIGIAAYLLLGFLSVWFMMKNGPLDRLMHYIIPSPTGCYGIVNKDDKAAIAIVLFAWWVVIFIFLVAAILTRISLKIKDMKEKNKSLQVFSFNRIWDKLENVWNK